MLGADVTGKFLSREELKEIINEVLDERQELVGMPTDTPEARTEHKKDMELLRSLRLAWQAGAKKIGNAILTALSVVLLALIGLGAKKMGAW